MGKTLNNVAQTPDFRNRSALWSNHHDIHAIRPLFSDITGQTLMNCNYSLPLWLPGSVNGYDEFVKKGIKLSLCDRIIIRAVVNLWEDVVLALNH
jgi:hypothetical protein